MNAVKSLPGHRCKFACLQIIDKCLIIITRKFRNRVKTWQNNCYETGLSTSLIAV